ncbi:MAG TPA: GntR family transcriptional regulator [Terriglobales bacterium]|nr:GntR family transcriptional regulator [Terriglobales bacterium]
MTRALAGFDTVERDTLQERIYRQIHHKLLTGQLLPGQQLSINALINALGGSAMPIREALRRLEAERLLVVGSNRSLTVPRLTAMQVAELRDMRLALEGMATERAAPNVTETDLTALAAICAEMEAAILAEDPAQYLDANWRFHLFIYQLSHMPLMCSIVQQLMARAAPYVRLGLNGNRGHMQRAMRHHYAALEALRRGDGAAARAAIEADILGATADFLNLDGKVRPALQANL